MPHLILLFAPIALIKTSGVEENVVVSDTYTSNLSTVVSIPFPVVVEIEEF
jgi:hypothetical protein